MKQYNSTTGIFTLHKRAHPLWNPPKTWKRIGLTTFYAWNRNTYNSSTTTLYKTKSGYIGFSVYIDGCINEMFGLFEPFNTI